jgi:hypothetical protein
VAAKMSRKFQECEILFAHSIEDTNRGQMLASEANDGTTRASQISLKRSDLRHGRMEMPLEQLS